MPRDAMKLANHNQKGDYWLVLKTEHQNQAVLTVTITTNFTNIIREPRGAYENNNKKECHNRFKMGGHFDWVFLQLLLACSM